ncbi:hydroxymethylglutaryl-CoA reductase [Nocardia salmonicida]|uniref:hydroxymethylglutaryl-CoA reductase n=1 Tax=Nocardia salmonicida TaxID=53431 RepID=UPI003631A160
MTTNLLTYTPIPTQWVGPIRITGNVVDTSVSIPLAIYESPLWPSVGRGAKVTRQCADGLVATLLDDRMTRSVILETDSAAAAARAYVTLQQQRPALEAIVTRASRYAKLVEVHHEIVGCLLFLRFEFTTGDAAGHNMATHAAERLMEFILLHDDSLRYASISGNYCADKKVSAVNAILGRGKSVSAELLIPREVVAETLHTTAERIVELNIRKNLVGSTLAGSLRSANAHYANMLLAFYLATGQDAANIVEGSQGITYVEARAEGLYFSCNLPNLIVGSVGNGKSEPAVADNLDRLGCAPDHTEPGQSARKLAVLAAAATLCGELSLLAAQTNPGELMKTHLSMERAKETI